MLAWPLLLAAIGYWAAAAYIHADLMIELADAFTVSAGFVIACLYFPGWLASIRTREPTAVDLIIVGMCTKWAFEAVEMLWRLVWRVSGTPEWMVNHHLLGFFISMSAFTGFLHIAARSSAGKRVPTRLLLLVTMVGGVLIAGAAYLIATDSPRGRPWATMRTTEVVTMPPPGHYALWPTR